MPLLVLLLHLILTPINLHHTRSGKSALILSTCEGHDQDTAKYKKKQQYQHKYICTEIGCNSFLFSHSHSQLFVVLPTRVIPFVGVYSTTITTTAAAQNRKCRILSGCGPEHRTMRGLYLDMCIWTLLRLVYSCCCGCCFLLLFSDKCHWHWWKGHFIGYFQMVRVSGLVFFRKWEISLCPNINPCETCGSWILHYRSFDRLIVHVPWK